MILSIVTGRSLIMADHAVTAREITRALADYVTPAAALSTTGRGPGRGLFTVHMPIAVATMWGLGNPVGQVKLERWLAARLDTPVAITDTRMRGRRAAVDLTVGGRS
jgi:hypothetical protein